MMDLLGGSAVLNCGRRIGNKIKETARQSLLLGSSPRRNAMEHSRMVTSMDRVHPVEGAVVAIGRSRILGWLYHYWGNLCAGPLVGFLVLFAPLLGILAVRMLLASRFTVAGGLLIALGICCLLFLRKGSLADWLSGSFCSRWFSIPAGEARRSVLLYLGCCGAIGGAVGWIAGVTLGLAAAAALAAFPILFRVPPAGTVYLLLALLPLCGTSICWALSIVVVVIYFFGRAFGGQPGKKIDGVDLLLLVFPLFCLVSAIFSFDRADSMKVIAMWLGLFACVPFIRRIVDTRRRLVSALAALTVGAVASGFYGLFQYFSGMVDTTWTDTTLFEDLQLRVYSTFANPNVYGEFLLLAIPLVAGLALHLKGWKRWLLLGADLLLMVNMVLTYSRGCYVGIALTAVVFLWNCSKKWLAAIATVGVPLAIVLMPESVAARILSIGNMSDTSTNYRLMIYIGTMLMFTRYWLGGVGVGEGAFNAIYPYFALSGVVAPHSHSLFFQIVVSFGIAGIVYLAVVWGTYQRRVDRSLQSADRKDRLLMLGFGSVFWGMLVQSVFDYTWYNYRVFQLFWIVLVLGFAAAEVLKKGENHG